MREDWSIETHFQFTDKRWAEAAIKTLILGECADDAWFVELRLGFRVLLHKNGTFVEMLEEFCDVLHDHRSIIAFLVKGPHAGQFYKLRWLLKECVKRGFYGSEQMLAELEGRVDE